MNSPVQKYNDRAQKINSLLCVGLDTDISKVSNDFLKTEFPQFEFNKWIIEETHQYTAAYKPNSAFYEARGDQGIKELKMTMDYLMERYPTIFTILDAKRADIGNTNNGYVTSIFDWLGFDAVTVHPYLGREAVMPFIERKDKVSIILARTSNPGAPEFQDLVLKETNEKLWHQVAKKVVNEWNKNNNLMMVVGATYPEEIREAREISKDMTFLVPGTGAQGGELKNFVKGGLNKNGLGMIINSSRGIIFADNPKEEAKKLCEEIRLYQKSNLRGSTPQ